MSGYMIYNIVPQSETMEEEEKVSPLYLSVTMTPVRYPRCFAALTPIYKTIDRNYLDLNTVCTAIAQFLALDRISTLYICGTEEMNAWPFYQDLKLALQTEPEIGFCNSQEEMLLSQREKHVVFISNPRTELVTPLHRYWAIPLLTKKPYQHFSREDFASLIACGNPRDGPDSNHVCASSLRVLCVRPHVGGKPTCGICFRRPLRGRLSFPLHLRPEEDLLEIDEGIVVEPLGVSREVYTSNVSDTDSSDLDDLDDGSEDEEM
nr:hypothetical protein [Tawny frogmouth aviadenovirus A]